jgi:hypothetical protein
MVTLRTSATLCVENSQIRITKIFIFKIPHSWVKSRDFREKVFTLPNKEPVLKQSAALVSNVMTRVAVRMLL